MSTSSPAPSEDRLLEDAPLDFREVCSVIAPPGYLPTIIRRKLEKSAPEVLPPVAASPSVALPPAMVPHAIAVSTVSNVDFGNPVLLPSNCKPVSLSVPVMSLLPQAPPKPKEADTYNAGPSGVHPVKIRPKKEKKSPKKKRQNSDLSRWNKTPRPRLGVDDPILPRLKPKPKAEASSSEQNSNPNIYTAPPSADANSTQASSVNSSQSQTSLLHQAASATSEGKPGNIIKHVLVNEPDTNQESVVQGFFLNSLEKNLVLVSDSKQTAATSTSSNQPVGTFIIQNAALHSSLQNGNANGKETPVQSLLNSQSLLLNSIANSPNMTNFAIATSAVKSNQETPRSNSPNALPKNKGNSNSIRLPVGGLQGKILQCTSTAVSINSTTCSPKQLAIPKSVVSSPNVLLSLASQKQCPSSGIFQNPNIIRLAVKNGKLCPDVSMPVPPPVNTSPQVSAAEAPKPPLKPIQSQQQAVTLSTPKSQMNLSTIPAIVPLNDPKLKSVLKGNVLSSLLHKGETDEEKPMENSSEKPYENPLLSAPTSTNISPADAAVLFNSTNVGSSPSTESESTSQILAGPPSKPSKPATGGPPGLYPLAMMSSDTTTTSAIMSAISSSSVPLLHIPETIPSQNAHAPSAGKPNGSLLVIPGIVPSSLPSLYLHPSGAYVTSLSSLTSNVTTESGAVNDVRVPSEILEAIASLSSIPVPVPEVPHSANLESVYKKLQDAAAVSASFPASAPNRVESFSVPNSKAESKQMVSSHGKESGKEAYSNNSKETLIISETDNKNKDADSIPDIPLDTTKKLLNWNDIGVGPLAGSSIKFRMNEFGMMEIDDNFDKKSDTGSDSVSLKDGSLDDVSTNKENFNDFLLCKEKVVEESVYSKENRNTNGSSKRNKRKEGRRAIRVDESDAAFQTKLDEKRHSNKKAKLESGESRKSALKNKDDSKEKESSGKEEILQCKGCNCYGLSDEFFNERACSADCEREVKQKLVIARKLEYDRNDVRLKKREKYYSLLKKEVQDQKHFGKDEIQAKLDKIEKIDIDKIDLTKLEAEIKGLDDFDEDSNIDVLSMSSDLSQPVEPAPSDIFKTLERGDAKHDSFEGISKVQNPFKVGMKLEGIDPEHQSNFCAMTVAEVKGYRMRLHFDGYNECHDFWVHANSPDIFPVGWCEARKRQLNPPLGYSKETFNWQSYLKQCRAKAASISLFRAPPTKVNNHFKKGMKLESVDRKNASLTCVSTVADVIDNRILIHFDSWGDVYDYWTDITAPYIHPVGWCQGQNYDLTPPTNHKSNKVFVWDEYLKETKSTAVPARAFKPQPNKFKVNMKLEAVDFRVPSLIRPATIIEIKDHRLRIAYDGFPLRYAYWVDCDNPDIFPPGWCEKTRHPLEPLPSMDEIGDCGTRGCKGIGHIKGPKFVRHFSAQYCPYSKQNIDSDADHIPDRLQGEPDAFEVDEPLSKPSVVKKESLETLEKPSKTLQMEQLKSSESKPVEKASKTSSEPLAPIASTSTAPEVLPKRRGRKRKFSKEMEGIKSDGFDVLRQEVIESVLRPGYTPSSRDSITSSKHASQLGINVIDADPRKWTSKQVTAFVTRIYNQPDKTRVFLEQEIDGEAFLMLTQKDIVDILGLKLGPAIKIFNAIVLLRQKIS